MLAVISLTGCPDPASSNNVSGVTTSTESDIPSVGITPASAEEDPCTYTLRHTPPVITREPAPRAMDDLEMWLASNDLAAIIFSQRSGKVVCTRPSESPDVLRPLSEWPSVIRMASGERVALFQATGWTLFPTSHKDSIDAWLHPGNVLTIIFPMGLSRDDCGDGYYKYITRNYDFRLETAIIAHRAMIAQGASPDNLVGLTMRGTEIIEETVGVSFEGRATIKSRMSDGSWRVTITVAEEPPFDPSDHPVAVVTIR